MTDGWIIVPVINGRVAVIDGEEKGLTVYPYNTLSDVIKHLKSRGAINNDHIIKKVTMEPDVNVPFGGLTLKTGMRIYIETSPREGSIQEIPLKEVKLSDLTNPNG